MRIKKDQRIENSMQNRAQGTIYLVKILNSFSMMQAYSPSFRSVTNWETWKHTNKIWVLLNLMRLLNQLSSSLLPRIKTVEMMWNNLRIEERGWISKHQVQTLIELWKLKNSVIMACSLEEKVVWIYPYSGKSFRVISNSR